MFDKVIYVEENEFLSKLVQIGSEFCSRFFAVVRKDGEPWNEV